MESAGRTQSATKANILPLRNAVNSGRKAVCRLSAATAAMKKMSMSAELSMGKSEAPCSSLPGKRATVCHQLLHHIAAQFLLKSVHILAFSLSDIMDQLGIAHFLDLGRSQILGFDLAAIGRISGTVFGVAHGAFIEVNILCTFLWWGKSEQSILHSQKQGEDKTSSNPPSQKAVSPHR
jgi:hypothetical protein